MRVINLVLYGRAAALALSFACLHVSACADSCVPASEASATSKDGRFELKARFDASSRSWKATLKHVKSGKVVEGAFEKLGWHTHIQAFVSDDGRRIVLFEPSAFRDDGDHLLVYDRSFNFLKAFSLAELLTPDEQGRKTRSISHVQFVEPDAQRKAYGWVEGDTFAFRAVGGRIVRIDVSEPRILGDTIAEPLTPGPRVAADAQTNDKDSRQRFGRPLDCDGRERGGRACGRWPVRAIGRCCDRGSNREGGGATKAMTRCAAVAGVWAAIDGEPTRGLGTLAPTFDVARWAGWERPELLPANAPHGFGVFVTTGSRLDAFTNAELITAHHPSRAASTRTPG